MTQYNPYESLWFNLKEEWKKTSSMRIGVIREPKILMDRIEGLIDTYKESKKPKNHLEKKKKITSNEYTRLEEVNIKLKSYFNDLKKISIETPLFLQKDIRTQDRIENGIKYAVSITAIGLLLGLNTYLNKQTDKSNINNPITISDTSIQNSTIIREKKQIQHPTTLINTNKTVKLTSTSKNYNNNILTNKNKKSSAKKVYSIQLGNNSFKNLTYMSKEKMHELGRNEGLVAVIKAVIGKKGKVYEKELKEGGIYNIAAKMAGIELYKDGKINNHLRYKHLDKLHDEIYAKADNSNSELINNINNKHSKISLNKTSDLENYININASESNSEPMDISYRFENHNRPETGFLGNKEIRNISDDSLEYMKNIYTTNTVKDTIDILKNQLGKKVTKHSIYSMLNEYQVRTNKRIRKNHRKIIPILNHQKNNKTLENYIMN